MSEVIETQAIEAPPAAEAEPEQPEAAEPEPEEAPLPEPEAAVPAADAEPIRADLLPARTGAVGSALADLPVIPAVSEATQIAQLAVTLAAAGACPSAIRGKPNDVFLVLLSARDLGVSLTTAMREFHVIDGKVTLSPKVKLALVRQSGLGKIWPAGDNGAEHATWSAERHDLPGHVISSTFTWADAQLAHLVDSRCQPHNHWKGSGSGRNSAECLCKTNWKTYPARMLSWRAAGYLLDDVFPEVGTGLYSPDELGAVTDAEGEPIEVRASEPLPGMRGGQRGGGQRAAADEPQPIDAEAASELRERCGRVKAHAEAKGDLAAWWSERGFPKIEELTDGQAKVLEAKLSQLEGRFSIAAPVAGADEAAAQQEPAPEPEEGRAALEPPEPAGEPQGSPRGPILLDPHVLAGGSLDGGPADGDVAGWLIEQASGMTGPKVKAAYKAAGLEPPEGPIAELRRAWAFWQFEGLARGCCSALSGFSIDPAEIVLPADPAEQG